MRAAICDDDLLVLSDRRTVHGAESGGITVVAGPDGFRRSVLLSAARRMDPGRGPRVLFAGSATTKEVASLRALSARLIEGSTDERAALGAWIARVSQRMPVAVVVDAAALSTGSYRTFLEELSQRAGTDAVLAVYAWRGGLPDDNEALSLRAAYHWADLRPLSAPTVEEIFRNALPVDLRATIVPQLYPAMGGNAALVAAALDDLSHADTIDHWMAGAGSSFGRAVQLVLNKQELSQAAQAIVVLGDHYDPATLSQVLELPLPRLSEVFDRLATLGLLAHGHELRQWVQTAVEAGTEPETMRRMHLRAAEVLHAEGASVQVVARHLLATDEALQPWALDALSVAADEAVRLRAFDGAAVLLKFALGWTAAPDVRIELRARLLDISWASDPRRSGEMLNLLTASAGDGHLAGHRFARLARLLAWYGRADDAQALLALATARAEDPRAEVELTISNLWVRHVFPQTPAIGVPDLRPELVMGRCPWLPRAVAMTTLLAEGNAEAAAAEAVEVLHRILPQESDLEGGQLALFVLLSLERADQILRWAQRFGSQIGDNDPPQWHSLVAAAEATVAFWSGDFGTAAGRAQAAIDLVGGAEWSMLAALPRAVLLMSLTKTGQHAEVAAAFAAPLPERVTRSPYGLLYLRARSQHHLATDAPQSAADDFRAMGEILTLWGLESPGLLPWQADLAEACLRLGDPETAGCLAREQLDALPAGAIWSRGRAMRLLAQTLPESEGLPLLHEAVALLERQGESLEQAQALEAMARAYQQAGDLAVSRSVRRRAEKMVGRRNPDPDPEVLPREESAAPAEPARIARRGQLSRAESKVAGLASRGYTNREISGMLYITMSTVEQHLTRIYRKLGIDRREKLDVISDVL